MDIIIRQKDEEIQKLKKELCFLLNDRKLESVIVNHEFNKEELELLIKYARDEFDRRLELARRKKEERERRKRQF